MFPVSGQMQLFSYANGGQIIIVVMEKETEILAACGHVLQTELGIPVCPAETGRHIPIRLKQSAVFPSPLQEKGPLRMKMPMEVTNQGIILHIFYRSGGPVREQRRAADQTIGIQVLTGIVKIQVNTPVAMVRK